MSESGSMGLRSFDEKFLTESRFSSADIQNFSCPGVDGQECGQPVAMYLDRALSFPTTPFRWLNRGFYCYGCVTVLAMNGLVCSYFVDILDRKAV